MKDNPIQATFSGTTINPQVIESYASDDPGFLECIVKINGSNLHKREANHADYFEYHLRRYVVGKTQTMHRVFAEIRQFRAFNTESASVFIPILIDRVEETIFLNEWYELMPRFERAKKRIKSRFGIQPVYYLNPSTLDQWHTDKRQGGE